MPYKLVAPIEQDFVLDKTDEFFGVQGEPSKISIRQATQEQHQRRSKLLSDIQTYFRANVPDTDADVHLRQTWSYEELRRLEVFLTLSGCNLEDRNSKVLFKFRKDDYGQQVLDMSESEFNRAWGQLPPLVAQEIHSKVLEVNISWKNAMGE